MRGVSTSSSRATPGPTAPTSPSKPKGPPETVKYSTATSDPNAKPRRGTAGRSVLVRVPPDHARVVAAEHGDVHHPAEDPRQEPAARRGARLRRRDPLLRAEDRPAVLRLGPALPRARRRHAPVDVFVPARQRQRDA